MQKRIEDGLSGQTTPVKDGGENKDDACVSDYPEEAAGRRNGTAFPNRNRPPFAS
jgi:hypothetical protein